MIESRSNGPQVKGEIRNKNKISGIDINRLKHKLIDR